MSWPFGHKDIKRDDRVTALEAEARVGEVSLVERIIELDRKRVTLEQLAEAALKDLGGPHRA